MVSTGANAQDERASSEPAFSEVISERPSNLSETIQELSTRLREIAENSEIIERRGAEMVAEFRIRPELFDSRAHALFFCAIALRYEKLENHKAELATSDYQGEKEFIANSLMLLAGDKSEYFDNVKLLIDPDNARCPEDIRGALEEYTNHAMTTELREAIAGGLLNGVKGRLGITPDNEDPYEVRVLDIGDDNTISGTAPVKPAGFDELPWDSPERQAWMVVFESDQEQRVKLRENAAELSSRLGMESISHAWVTNLNGTRTINIHRPLAEKILHGDVPRPAYYDEEARGRDLATLEHEYVHTQGRLNLDGDIFYGICFEEIRAEMFSGDKMGYQEIKGFILDFQAVTGVNIRQLMQGIPKGGGAYDVYAAIAESIELEGALEMALTVPNKYLDDSRPMQKQVQEWLGGRDGVTRRLYMQMLRDSEKAASMDARIDKWAECLSEAQGQGWLRYRKDRLNLVFMTEIVEERVARLSGESQKESSS